MPSSSKPSSGLPGKAEPSPTPSTPPKPETLWGAEELTDAEAQLLWQEAVEEGPIAQLAFQHLRPKP
jgi:hypothetical protein